MEGAAPGESGDEPVVGRMSLFAQVGRASKGLLPGSRAMDLRLAECALFRLVEHLRGCSRGAG